MPGEVKVLTGRELSKHRLSVSITIDAAAAIFSRALGRLITVNIVAGWENNFITIPKDLRLEMLNPLAPLKVPASRDPKTLWDSLEHRLKPSVRAAAMAMCKMRDDGDEDKPCPCTENGIGACRAFELFGREAVAAVTATDQIQKGHLHAGVYSVHWVHGDT